MTRAGLRLVVAIAYSVLLIAGLLQAPSETLATKLASELLTHKLVSDQHATALRQALGDVVAFRGDTRPINTRLPFVSGALNLFAINVGGLKSSNSGKPTPELLDLISSTNSGCAAVPPNLIVCDSAFLSLLHAFSASYSTIEAYTPGKDIETRLQNFGQIALPLAASLIRYHLHRSASEFSDAVAMTHLRDYFRVGKLIAPPGSRVPYVHFFVDEHHLKVYRWSLSSALSIILAHETAHLSERRHGNLGWRSQETALCSKNDTDQEDAADKAAIDFVISTRSSMGEEGAMRAMLALLTLYKEVILFVGFDGVRQTSAEAWRLAGWNSGLEGPDQIFGLLTEAERQDFYRRISAWTASAAHMNMLLRLDRYVEETATSSYSQVHSAFLVSWAPLYREMIKAICIDRLVKEVSPSRR